MWVQACIHPGPIAMKPSHKTYRSIATALTLSVCSGFLFRLIGIPLPWMLGPMFAVGLAGIHDIQVRDIPGGRQAGQLIIGCGLGLYFSPEVSRQLLEFGGYILASAFAAIFIGATGGVVMRRISGISPVTAFFASVPGGASEMAVMAERAGARFDQVALCHSLRVLLVVSIVPIAVTMTGASGDSVYIPLTTAVNPFGLLQLILIAVVCGFLFMKAGVPNAWLLGPLLISSLFTIGGMSLSSIPQFLSVVAQILIGCSLGSRFKPSLRSESRRLMLGIFAGAAVTLSLSAILGVAMAWLIGESIASGVLATSPGGLSEMCITAKILKLGVPLVTSFQVARLAIVVTCSLPIWKIMVAIKGKT